MLGFLINRWVLGGLAGLVLFGFVYFKGVQHGKEVIQQKWDAEKIVWQQQMQAAAAKTIEVERNLQAKADNIQKERNYAVQNANVRYYALLNSLHERPETRAETGVPKNSEDSVGCTGEGLARPDAEFLAGYAADAAKLQAAYETCRTSYEVIYKELNQPKQDP